MIRSLVPDAGPPAWWGRVGLGALAVGGAVWWLLVWLVPDVRVATLGGLPPVVVACLDLPLFVGASALAASGTRAAAPAAFVAAGWTALVAVFMTIYASVTTLAGWGAVAMLAAAAVALPCALAVKLGRFPTEWLLFGPFTFRPTSATRTARIVGATFAQLVLFWGVFLGVLPALILWAEARWGLHLEAPGWVRWAGAAVFVAAGALGVYSAVTMSVAGRGTPLPGAMAHELVVSGPYRWVRNPMAVAGVAQGVAVGLALSSWMVIAYALVGALLWNAAIRPHEEADLARRFGASFDRYRENVSCWWPRRAAAPEQSRAHAK